MNTAPMPLRYIPKIIIAVIFIRKPTTRFISHNTPQNNNLISLFD